MRRISVLLSIAVSFILLSGFVLLSPSSLRNAPFDTSTTHSTRIPHLPFLDSPPAAEAASAPRSSTAKSSSASNSATSGLAVQPLSGTLTPEGLANMLVGTGIVVSNVTYTGTNSAAGTFSGGTGIIGFEDGIILSTGLVTNTIGPNSIHNIGNDNGLPGDSDLNAIITDTTHDASVLEFDFVPVTNTVSFDYVFGSDEYREYVDDPYNDVFAFFVNGNDLNHDCARINGVPVSIKSINDRTNSTYFRNNDRFSDPPPPTLINTELDGLTTVLRCSAAVTPGTTSHLKMAIADTNDSLVDSDVFLRAGSFSAGPVGPTNPELYGGGSPCECKTTTDAGQPVDTAIGNFYHTFTDFDIPVRGDPILFSHTYNSQAANVLTPLGYGWTHTLNMYIDSDSDNYYVHEGNGSILPFPKSGPPYPRVQATLTRDPSTGEYTFTRTHGRQSYHFLSGGQLAGITDHNGYVHTLSLDPTSFLPTGIRDAADRTILTVVYNGQTPNMISRVYDLTGRTVYFDYDTNYDLRSVTDVGEQITRFAYDTQHRLLTMTDPNGGVITNTYDLQNRVLTQTDSMTRTLQFGYTTLDSTHTQTVLTDSLGYTSVYTYDQNRLTDLTRNPGTAEAATWQYGYDPNFPTAVSSITDPLTHTWSYTWDTHGNQLSATDPLSRTTAYAYNATNDLLVITNTRGLTTTFSYDASGNPLTVTRPVTETNDLAVARLGYDPAHPGEVLTITNPLNNSWLLVHDPTTGYVLTSTNPLTQSTGYTYDTAGRVVGMVSPRGYPSAAAYDAYDAPVRITDTLGFTTTFAYDANHNPITITDTKGFTTTYHYNADDELIRVTRADGTHSDYAYDANGHVISQTNALTQTTRYGYDAYNRLVSMTDPLTRTTAYGYDLAGNMTVMTDALGLTTTLGYDAANQLTAITHQDPLSTPNVAFAYNLLGQRTVMTDGTGTSLYSYDSLDRLVAAQNGAQRTVGYHYDLAGQLTQLDYPGVTSGTGQVQRQYDAAGRLHEVEDWLGNTSTFDYNADGNLTQIAYGNGVLGAADYDAAGRVVAITDTVKGGDAPFLALTYTRDPLGLLHTAAEGSNTDTYGYDGLTRLQSDGLSGAAPSSRIWSYDGVTEIITTSYQLGAGTPLTTTRSYDAANALSSLLEQQGSTVTQNLTFTYDLKGNRTQQRDAVSGDIRSYTYDQANRLLNINPTALHGPLASFQYNGDGLRMEKDATSGCCTQSHAYTWDVGAGLPLLLQENATNYIYGPGGLVLEQIQDSGTTGTPYYYHSDQLGSVRAVTNQAGAVVNTYAYDAYGTTTASSETIANPFRYAGEYQDAESGLYYLRARYYDPASQQFLTRDPLVAATEQAYNYAGGSPLNGVDPSGLYWDTPGDYRGAAVPAIPPLWCSILGLCSPQEQIAKQYYDDLADAYAKNIWDNMPAHITGGMDDPSGAGQLGRSAALVGLGGPACAPDGAGGGSSEPPEFTTRNANRITSPGESPVWKGFQPYKGKIRISGQGRGTRYYQWDYTHHDIEVYDRNGNHLGSMEPITGQMYKPPVKGRTIQLP